MNILHTVRVVVLGLVLLFSFIVLALAAALTNTTESDGFYFTFAALALAVSIITLLTVTPILVFDHIRTGFITSKIVVELIVLGILSVLWLGTAADTASYNPFAVGCDGDSSCSELQAIEGFSFLNWILLMVYCIALLVVSIIHGRRHSDVWHSSVKETNFSMRSARPGGIV